MQFKYSHAESREERRRGIFILHFYSECKFNFQLKII